MVTAVAHSLQLAAQPAGAFDIFPYRHTMAVMPRAATTSDVFNAIAETSRRDILVYLADGTFPPSGWRSRRSPSI